MKYVGSKNRLSKYIAPIIQSYIDGMGDKCFGYLEPFVGGANMIDKIVFPAKFGNDNNKYLIALLKHAQECVDDFPDTITEDEYNSVRLNRRHLDCQINRLVYDGIYKINKMDIVNYG